MSNLITRTIWGGLFVGILVVAILLNGVFLPIVLGLIMMLGIAEFLNLFKHSTTTTIKPSKLIGIIGGLVLYTVVLLNGNELLHIDVISLIVPIIFIPFISILFSKNKNPLIDLSVTFFSWIYVLIPILLIAEISAFQVDGLPAWTFVLGLFILVWTNDTFAYLAGISFGKHKLFERISPKKTWEGFFGGLLFTLLIAYLYAFFTQSETVFWVCAAVLIAPTSVFGDLIESRFKRLADVKDSGTLIPGHGGILDRIDALLYAAPFFYLLFSLFY